jgi:hypothetical protein
MFVMFPNIFLFQFLTNGTLVYVMIMRAIGPDKNQMLLLMLSTFLFSYLALEGLKY